MNKHIDDFLNIYFYLHLCVCLFVCFVPQRPGEDIGSSGTGGPGSCGPCKVDVSDCWSSAAGLNCWALFPAHRPQFIYLPADGHHIWFCELTCMDFDVLLNLSVPRCPHLQREDIHSCIPVKTMWCRLKEVPKMVSGSQQGRPLCYHMGLHTSHTCSLLSCQLPGPAFISLIGRLAGSRVWSPITRSPSATVPLRGSPEFPGTRSLLCEAQLVA